jgi:hypothetical protein
MFTFTWPFKSLTILHQLARQGGGEWPNKVRTRQWFWRSQKSNVDPWNFISWSVL